MLFKTDGNTHAVRKYQLGDKAIKVYISSSTSTEEQVSFSYLTSSIAIANEDSVKQEESSMWGYTVHMPNAPDVSQRCGHSSEYKVDIIQPYTQLTGTVQS